jgi:Uncharacterized protein conserved in archaea
LAAPFLRRGTDAVTRTEFVYSLTGDLGWFEPKGAEEALERGIEEGLLEERDGLRPGFDIGAVEIPEGSSPDMDAVNDTNTSAREGAEADGNEGTDKRGVFERAVERLVGAGYEKREAVAEINRKHTEMGDVRVEAAALLVAKEQGLRVSDLAEDALEDLRR